MQPPGHNRRSPAAPVFPGTVEVLHHHARHCVERRICGGNRCGKNPGGDQSAQARRQFVAGTEDPVLYRHGMHHKDMTAYVTVGPGTYHVRLKLMEHRATDPATRAMDVYINGRPVARRLDIAATASGRPSTLLVDIPGEVIIYDGLNTAVDLVFNDIQPEHGVIAVRLAGCNGSEAILSALEVGPGPGGEGAQPIAAPSTQPAR